MGETRLLTLIGLIYAGVPALMAAGLLPFEHRFTILVAMAAAFAALAFAMRLTPRALGITLATRDGTLALHAGVTVLLVAGTLCAVAIAGRGGAAWPGPGFALFYLLVSCPAQEFLYRAFPHALLRRKLAVGAAGYVAASTAAYTWMHVIYLDPVVLAFSAAAGLAWGTAYVLRPNLPLVSLSHTVAGLVAMWFGFI